MNILTCCKFCHKEGIEREADYIAGQHTGGDIDIPATWVPVCSMHFKGWFEGLTVKERLPCFKLKDD